MKCSVKFRAVGFADCDLEVQAKGFLLAAVSWADENGALPGWSALAVFPIAPAGVGHYRFRGQRAIPNEATHLFIQYVSADFSIVEKELVLIPKEYRPCAENLHEIAAFTVMSDLHLSGNPRKVFQAFRSSEKAVLIAGDLTNDGDSSQFARFRDCIEKAAENRLILTVTGNHDQLLKPNQEETFGYEAFQKYLFERAEGLEVPVHVDSSGAYSVSYAGVDIIGLHCVTPGRRFVFPEGRQLEWLEHHLEQSTKERWHIILCHAPLSTYMSHRKSRGAYLSRDSELQEILNRHKNIIFVSGHTHFSPNIEQGTVQWNQNTKSIYIDDGSVCPTELSGEYLAPSDWKDGVIAELKLYDTAVEIMFRSIRTGAVYPRGYYKFQ